MAYSRECVTAMIRRLLLIALSLNLCSTVSAAEVDPTAPETGASIYRTLLEQGLMDDYMNEFVRKILRTLVDASAFWPDFQLNGPYAPGLVNIYIVDSHRLPNTNVLDAHGVHLTSYSLKGNAISDHETGVLFVDTGLLKSLVTAALMFGESGIDTGIAVATIKARGIESFRQHWDPALNPVLETAGDTDRWVILASGALAFILAHEMGHLYFGGADVSQRRKPMRFRSSADKDLHWACPDLIDERYVIYQQIEQEADDFAASLLSKILFAEDTFAKPMLRYELGTRWYLVYILSEQLIEILYATENQNLLTVMRLQLGAETYDKLIAARPSSGRGIIGVLFPKSHPATLRRASTVLRRLNRSSYSLYHDELPANSNQLFLIELILHMECKNLGSGK